MESDADWASTYAGAYGPGKGPTKGSMQSYEAYQQAVKEHGVKSSQANQAINAAIKDGWSPDGITLQANGGKWPSGGGRRSGGDRRSGGGLPSFGKPVDQ